MKNKAVTFAFAFYKTVRTLLGFGVCSHIPTCSQYAKESFAKHSFFRALFLSSKRLLRCHPFSRGGFDPVP